MTITCGNQIDFGFNIVGKQDPTIIFVMGIFRFEPFKFPPTSINGATVVIVSYENQASFSRANINTDGCSVNPGDQIWLKEKHVYVFVFNSATSRWDLKVRDLNAGDGYGPVNIAPTNN